MPDEQTPARQSNDTADAHAQATPQAAPQLWVSWLAVLACAIVFLGLAARNDYESLDTLAKFGYLPADAIWNGGYWALVTSAFVHFALWHVAFNVYWLWIMGSRLEQAIGSLQYLGFVLGAAFVSSSLQLAVSDSTGIGASGVVYAIFGFMWLTRYRYPRFNEVLDVRTIQIFLIWLIGCVVATYLKVWQVGNAAHISGLLFGGAIAGAFVLRYKRPLATAGLAALVILAVIPLFWCPWSVAWLSHRAYNAHAAGHYDLAIDRYTQVIQADPKNAWAYLNRSLAYEAVGQLENAQSDLRRAREIDPAIERAN